MAEVGIAPESETLPVGHRAPLHLIGIAQDFVCF